MQAPVAEPRLLPGQRQQLLPQLTIASLRPVAKCRYGDSDELAGAPFTDLKRLAQMLHVRLQACELSPFFAITDFSDLPPVSAYPANLRLIAASFFRFDLR